MSSARRIPLSKWLPLAAFAVLIVLLSAGVMLSRNPDRSALPSPLIGKPAPVFRLPVLGEPARSVGSTELRGAPYVLNVWGSWCPECRVEHPVISRLSASGRVRVVGYNWKDDAGDAARWLQQFGNPYELILADHQGKVAIDWGIYGAPETFLVDARGIVRWKHVGALTDAVVRDELLSMLGNTGTAQ